MADVLEYFEERISCFVADETLAYVKVKHARTHFKNET